MEPQSPYTAADRQRWRQSLLAKGQEVSENLARVLAGKEVTLADFELTQRDEVREPKDKRLRRFLDLLMARLRVVEHPRFGFDPARQSYAPVAELDAQPWLEFEP